MELPTSVISSFPMCGGYVLAKANRVVHHVAHLADPFLEDPLCSFGDGLGALGDFGELLEWCLVSFAVFDARIQLSSPTTRKRSK